MSNTKKRKKTDTVIITFQADKHLRKTFDNVCKNNDETMSQVLRRCMKQYINSNQQGGLLS